MGKGVLSDAEGIFKQMLSIGLFGLLFLIIFGNLSGNLGWETVGISVVNETGAWGHNATAYIVDQAESVNASNVGATGFTLTDVWGRTVVTDGVYDLQMLPLATNYSLSSPGGLLTNLTGFNNTLQSNLTVSYDFVVDSERERDTDKVIGNLTAGNVSFFSFMPTIFTLLAITVLILVILTVIRKVNVGLGGKGSKGFSN